MSTTSFQVSDPFKEYRAVLIKVAEFSERIFAAHQDEITCHKGCSQCCVDGLSVLPIEAQYIQAGLREEPIISVQKKTTAHCVFLDSQGACQIYAYRPLVCRTHGFPLHWGAKEKSSPSSTLRILDDDIVTCELNFTTRNKIEKEKALDEITLQKLLYVVNVRFCEQNEEKRPNRRIPLVELVPGKKS